ncbi:MAG: hypothetical protein ACI8WB_000009 [Phenylobacterium sp.]|jgi:hypothetical protein
MINKLRGIFDGKVVKRFSKNQLVFVEESKGSALRKLSIRCNKKALVNQQLPDTVFIEADFANGEYAKYSSFVKNDTFFLTKQCDFFILHQTADQLYVAICDMKSSKGGDDSRCEQQIKHAEFFLTYILDSVRQSEEYKREAKVAISDYIFIKLLFIPDQDFSMAMPLTVNVEEDESNPPFKIDGETNFHPLDMEDGGKHAQELWRNIQSRFP